MELLKQIFTWWNSQTLGTRLYTWRRGKYVGSDSSGNLFYESDSRKRRWVIFNKDIDASVISSEWHGWLHHTVNLSPTSNKPVRKKWEKPHLANKTGSEFAYHPLGINRSSNGNYSDYKAWLPDND
jgi:NADH:ubiquinone oxidoreductase subunit